MEQVEEVVETEAITLATADGQIVRVISKEQYDRLLAAASKNKTYKCDTCNRRFTNTNAFQNHYNLRWTVFTALINDCYIYFSVLDGRKEAASTRAT